MKRGRMDLNKHLNAESWVESVYSVPPPTAQLQCCETVFALCVFYFVANLYYINI